MAGHSSSSTIIFFLLSLHYDTSEMGIYYDDIALKFYYVGTQVISWEEVSKNVSEIVLRLSLVTRVRFENSGWKSKKHELLVQGDVKVNPFTGKKIERGIELCPYKPDGSGGTLWRIYGFYRVVPDIYVCNFLLCSLFSIDGSEFSFEK